MKVPKNGGKMKTEKCKICGRQMLVYEEREVYICSRCEDTVLIEDYMEGLIFSQ